MPGIYAGDTKALVFPVMCDGYIKLDYTGGDTSKNEATTELALRGGFWGHQGNFSIEAIITPYDVNGYGTNSSGGLDVGIVNSEKTPPSLNADVTSSTTKNKYQSFKYFGETYTRRNQKMMIFHNSNFSFYLDNNTGTNNNTFNINQPAEYRLVVDVNDTLVISESVITASNTLYGYYDENGIYNGISTSKTKLDGSSLKSGETHIIVLDTATNSNKVGVGTELFNSTGASIGKINSISGAELTLDTAASSGDVYFSQPKEALYLEGIYKVGCSYSNGVVGLYINGNLIKEQKTSGTFSFDPSDSFIGQNGSNTNTQFMGELYEICMYKRTQPTETINTLSPGYHDILFYYRFGDN
jgi:hypothetical protein